VLVVIGLGGRDGGRGGVEGDRDPRCVVKGWFRVGSWSKKDRQPQCLSKKADGDVR
jgi:hypothetical protein